MENGFIVIDRKIVEWEWYLDVNTFKLWLHCLIRANWKDGRFQGIDVPRGSFITSLEHLATETGLSVRNVRTSLEKLEKSGCLTRTSTNKFTVINVLKYREFQDLQSSDRQADGQTTDKQLTNDRQTTDKQLTTIEPYNQVTSKPSNQLNNNIASSSSQNSQLLAPVPAIVLNNGSEYIPDYDYYEKMKELYPAVDIDQAFKEMSAWSMSNPQKRKTSRGVKAFINNWLSKEQNRGPRKSTGSGSKKNKFEEFAF